MSLGGIFGSPGAVGYVDRDVSGFRQMADEERIRSRARRLGYNLLKIVAFGVHTDRPMERLTNVVKHLEVEAVFTPNLHHFDGFEIPRELHAIATVYTVDQESEYKRKRRRAHQGRRA